MSDDSLYDASLYDDRDDNDRKTPPARPATRPAPAKATTTGSTRAGSTAATGSSTTGSTAATGGGGTTGSTTDDSGDPADTVDEQKQADADQQQMFARRRRRLRLAAAVLFVITVLLVVQHTQQPAGNPTHGPSASAIPSIAAPDAKQSANAETRMRQLLTEAQAFQQTNHTYRGFTSSSSTARVAAGKTTIVIVDVIDGKRWYTGILPGKPVKVLYDPTGTETSITKLTDVQRTIDESDQQAVQDSTGTATALLSRAVETVQGYANSNLVGDAPSFTGIAGTYIDGVTIVANTGTTVTLQAISGESCVVSEVTATRAGEPVAADCQ